MDQPLASKDASAENQLAVGIASFCDVLGPLFLKDPAHEPEVLPLYDAIAALDVDAAAAEWPFVEAAEAAHDLHLMQQGISDDRSADDDAIVWEFRRLFVGPNPMPAPPWGSVYTDREQVIFGQSTLALREWMRGEGIERLGDEKTPEDHIGLMLLLLAWIARHRPELTVDYLEHHLLTWSSHFLDELADAAEQPLFEGLARLTRASLEGLQAELDIVVQYPRFYR